MEITTLSLSIDEGQKKGETFDRRPGSFIRIGRVIRGNTVGIKDPRISQKHLIIEFHSEISRWTVTDLGTSNGTSVNGAFITPNVAFHLSDGDCIKIGESTLMSVKISAPCLAPEPRTRRGRRVAAAASCRIEREIKEEKMSEPAKHVEKGASEIKIRPKSANIEDSVKLMPEEGKRRMPTRASSKPSSAKVEEKVDVREKPTKNYQMRRGQRKKDIISAENFWNEKVLEKRVAEDRRSATRAIERSSRALKEKKEEREVGHEKVDEPTKNACKGMGCSGGTSEKIEGLVNDGRGAHSKKGSVHFRVSWKDDVLEPAVVQGRKGRVTRASTRAVSTFSLVSKVHEDEDEEIKEEKAEEPTNNRRKQGANRKRAGRSCRILNEGMARSTRVPKGPNKKKMMAALDLISVYSTGQEKKKMIVKNNASGDRKKLSVSREVMSRIEEADNDKDILMSRNSKRKLAYSWSSFSKIRGIPNTTRKYREDKLINCHATPFEARVERALNRGISESSSSMET